MATWARRHSVPSSPQRTRTSGCRAPSHLRSDRSADTSYSRTYWCRRLRGEIRKFRGRINMSNIVFYLLLSSTHYRWKWLWMAGSTWWKHGRGSTSDSILSLFGEVWDPPNKDAIKGGGRHFPQSTLHLCHGEILQPHRPLQLPHLQHKPFIRVIFTNDSQTALSLLWKNTLM